METPVSTFASWLERPFKPRRVSGRGRGGARCVIIRYRGSFARSAAKTLVVLVFLAILSGTFGERPGRALDAIETVRTVASAGPSR